MDKIWYAERIKECKSVKPEIVRLLKEEFKISDKDFDCIMYDLESQYHSTPDTLLRMAILNKCAKRGYDYEDYYYESRSRYYDACSEVNNYENRANELRSQRQRKIIYQSAQIRFKKTSKSVVRAKCSFKKRLNTSR